MAKIISINNRKGGSSKTTTAVNLSYEFAKNGKKTLLIDLDPQGNSSCKFRPDNEDIIGIVEVFTKQASIRKAIYQTEANENLYLIPSKLELDDVSESMLIRSQVSILSKALKEVKDEFDVIVIDTNPDLSILLRNCVYAADLILIPVNIDRNSIKGVDQTLRKIQSTIEDSPINLNVDYRLFFSMVTLSKGDETIIARKVIQAVKERYGKYLLSNFIRMQSKPAQLQTFEDDYFATDEDTGYGEDYRMLKKEVEGMFRWE